MVVLAVAVQPRQVHSHSQHHQAVIQVAIVFREHRGAVDGPPTTAATERAVAGGGGRCGQR